jgi:gamma-glutamyl-gamma-aminobutyrate hydrolase PuuD
VRDRGPPQEAQTEGMHMSHNRPYVGILVSDYTDKDGYIETIKAAGAEPRVLPPYPNLGSLQNLIGVLVTGVGPTGRNVHPALYDTGVNTDASIPDTDINIDLQALVWLHMFRMHRVPVAATCLGHQLWWVLCGGRLKSGIPGHTGSEPNEDTTTTTVQLTPDSLLAEVAGGTTLDVVCMHSQGAALPPIPSGLIVTGHSALDNEIHAVETGDGSFYGTQFHPEKMPNFGIAYYAAMIGRWQQLQAQR